MPDAQNNLREALFERYYIREGRMFSEQSTRCCMDLIIRRILDAKAYVKDADPSRRKR